MDLHHIRDALQAYPPFGEVEYHESLGSTNDRVYEVASGGAREGLIVISEHQSSGRGRRGHRWQAEPGSALLFSLLLRPRFQRQCWPLIGPAVAVSVAEAILALTGLNARCKWPNDVLLPRPGSAVPGKVAGILAEARHRHVVVGVGINVTAAPELAAEEVSLPPTSLAESGGAPPAREALLLAVVRHLAGHYGALQGGDARALHNAYTRLDTTTGRAVTLQVGQATVRGVAMGMDPTGALIVDTEAGVRHFPAGEVHPDWEPGDWMIG